MLGSQYINGDTAHTECRAAIIHVMRTDSMQLSSTQRRSPHFQQGSQSPAQPDSESRTLPASPPESSAATNPHETELLKAYLSAIQGPASDASSVIVNVPLQSTLGQWLMLYRAQIEHPVVQRWLNEQNIDQSALLTINPTSGTLIAQVGAEKKHFTLTDTSGWRQVSAPLLAAARVIAPGNVDELQVQFGTGSIHVNATVVSHFQGETPPKTLAQTRTLIRRLYQNQAFDPIPNDDRLRPASSRSAQALEQHKQDAAKFYIGAPQALAYTRLAVDVANTLPDVRAEAKKWAESLIFQLTGKYVDADTIYLNRFKSSSTPLSRETATVTGWEHPNEEPYSSLRLPDALLKNFSEHDWDPGSLDLEAGLYMDGPGKSQKGGYGSHNQFPLAPSTVMHASWKTDFQAQMSKKIDTFWKDQLNDYEVALKGEFVFQARKQLKAFERKSPAEQALQAPEHGFTRDDYRMVMAAAPHLPLDENAPLTVEQLKAKAPVKGNVQVHALDIGGFPSSDILRFTDLGNHQQILYIPGAEPAFLKFASVEALDQWIAEQTKNVKISQALLAHFPLLTRQNHEPGTLEYIGTALAPQLSLFLKLFIGSPSKVAGLDSIFQKLSTGKLEPGAAEHSSLHTIKGDAFASIAHASKVRMASDADSVIKSNSEVTRDAWLNDVTVAAGLLAKLAPIAAPVAAAAVVTGLTEFALGAEKEYSGDTEAERKDGASKAFDGLLNTLFSVGAEAPLKDPLIPPEEEPLASIPGKSPRIVEPEVNRLRPSQAGNISEHAVADGEQLIENATCNAKGIYQVKDATTGEDHWFIRFTDSTGVRQVYEIKGNFKLSNEYVQIIQRETGKPVLTVYPTADGEWRVYEIHGGKRHRGRALPAECDTYMDRILSGNAANDVNGDPAVTGQIRRWFRRDMDIFYNNLETNGMPARPSPPVMTINSTPESAIQSTLSQPGVRGLVLGEIHDEPAAYQLVIDQMQEFQDSGVTTIYVEGAPFIQGSSNIADAALLPSDAPYFGQHPYDPAYTGGPTLVDIINEAKKHGIKVIGLEHLQLTWRTDNPMKMSLLTHPRGAEFRLKEFNYFAAKIIDQTPPGEKFVAIVGKSHMNTDYGVPGIAELTDGVGMSVTPSLKGGSSIVSQPPHTPAPTLKLLRGTSIPEPYGDIHVNYNIDALTD